MEKSVINWRDETTVKKRRLGFLKELHDLGIKLPDDKILFLQEHNYIERGKAYKKLSPQQLPRASTKEIVKRQLTPVETSEWMPPPDEVNNYPKDFVSFIDSINSDFQNVRHYDRFEKYCRQAEYWLAENLFFSDHYDAPSQWKFALEETQRIKDNSLYFLDKYVRFKSGTEDNKYFAHKAQKLICFLIDSGYCLMIGKGRQIWFSTTIGAIAVKRINFHSNYFVKFIAENLIKSVEIFEDKIKYPFYHLPEWMKCTVQSDQERQFRLLFKGTGTNKGNISGADSKLFVEAPYVTAINGGSPDLILMDEIGQMSILGDIIDEGRPTLYSYDPVSGRQKRTRQLVAFGTGGETDRGGAEMETEYNTCIERWNKREFSYGIVPVFLSWKARPGITQEHYDEQKEIAYSSGKEEKKVRFHQHYPATIQDMFLSSAETVIPISHINASLQKIYDNPIKCIRGHYEPVYDLNRKIDNGFVPYHITGCNFVPSTVNDEAPVTIFQYPPPPEEKWADRFFQGTDPINSQSGYSYLSSSIWDALDHKVSATLNARSRDYRNEYLQSYLMNIHFGRPPHLIEINVGRELVNLIDALGGYRTLLPQSMLPKSLQVNSSDPIGIKKVASNTPFIHNRLLEMLEAYRENIGIEEFFIQLKTFVKKESSKGASVNFDVTDYRYHRNDVIYGIIYAYICAECYSHREPRNTAHKDKKRKVMQIVCNKDTGYENRLQEVWV